MRPAGYSSDEDNTDDSEDDYFSVVPLPKSHFRDPKYVQESLSEKIDGGLRDFLDDAAKTDKFHRAAEESNFELMRELIKDGISIDKSNISEWTPLMKACSQGNTEVAKFLLENGANPNVHKELFTPLMACSISSYVPEEDRLNCVRLLLDHGADVNAIGKHKETVLIQAVTNGLGQIVAKLLAVPSINVNAQDGKGQTALFYAVKNNDKDLAAKLLDAGIDVNIRESWHNYTAFEVAEMKDNKVMMDILRPYCNDLPEPDEEGDGVYESPLEEFLKELPDSDGKGGYSSETRSIFAGVGQQKLYDRLKVQISFPEFLVMTDDLDKIGVKLSPVRRRILTGIRRFHLRPWSESSLHTIQPNKPLRLYDFINLVANITKHLSILYATLHYVRMHIRKRSKHSSSSLVQEQLIDVMMDSYEEIEHLKWQLKNILGLINTIKPAGEVEADFVGKTETNNSKRCVGCVWAILTAASIGGAIYYKYR